MVLSERTLIKGKKEKAMIIPDPCYYNKHPCLTCGGPAVPSNLKKEPSFLARELTKTFFPLHVKFFLK